MKQSILSSLNRNALYLHHMTRTFSFLISMCLTVLSIQAQNTNKDYQIVSIGFYNLENLFDTLDSPNTNDAEFTPTGYNRYTYDKYQTKLANLSKVVSELGADYSEDGLAILGVAEIENRSVLEDFVKQKPIRKRNYQIVHEESPDRRGIDVALLYNPKYFTLEKSEIHPLYFIRDNDTSFTRDILQVTGLLNGERTHVLVNHWPSRSGGEKRTIYRRIRAADKCRAIYDKLRKIDPLTKVIVMGDLNDDPVSPSVKTHLRAEGKLNNVGP